MLMRGVNHTKQLTNRLTMNQIQKLFFLLALVCTSGAVSAQSFGLRVGVNSTNATFDRDDLEIDTDGQTNLMIGAFVNLPLGTEFISIQPEVNYLNRGYSGEISVLGQSVERTVAYFDLGGLVRLNFGSDEGLGFYVGAGPMYSYAVSGTVTDIGGDRDVDFDSDRLNRSELQFAGAAGLTFGGNFRFFVEARYNGSFSDQSDLNEDDIRQRSVGVNGGIMIPLGN